MNAFKSIIFTTTAVLAINISIAYSNLELEIDEDLEHYMTECNAPVELYDPEAMAKTMSNPTKFIQLVKQINHPATANSLVECAIHPEQMQTMILSLSNPIKYMNMMVIFMNPQTYMNWIAASAEPEFNQLEFEMVNAEEMSNTIEKFLEFLAELQSSTD